MNDREITLRRAILEELDNTPRTYLQPGRALYASLRLSVCPPPSDVEFSEAMRRLEAEQWSIAKWTPWAPSNGASPPLVAQHSMSNYELRITNYELRIKQSRLPGSA